MNLLIYSYNNPINWTDLYGLKTYIDIRRKSSTTISISGIITVRNEKGDIYQGYTVEPIKGGKYKTKEPVEAGTYDAFLRIDHKPNRIELRDVPNYDNIQIHIGNDPIIDSDGCFLVGDSPGVDWVKNSADAMKKILKIINNDATGEIQVTIMNIYDDLCE